ncbi:hypothetical protein GCWU000246_00816 [Jonquetella anthropi E3_33 E1]|nr:hypothetical protein GCWU000246_00816 [Jonquetella anthropi E3_33 E1]
MPKAAPCRQTVCFVICLSRKGQKVRRWIAMAGNETGDFFSFGSLMGSPNKLDYPDWTIKLTRQISGWFSQRFTLSDGYEAPYDEAVRSEPELLFDRLNWVNDHACLLPSSRRPRPRDEAAVVWLGEVDLDGAMRWALDYALLFSGRRCRRAWILTDCWIPCDVLDYSDHIASLADQQIVLRFLLITPWGWLELPLSEDWSSGRLSLFRGRSRK